MKGQSATGLSRRVILKSIQTKEYFGLHPGKKRRGQHLDHVVAKLIEDSIEYHYAMDRKRIARYVRAIDNDFFGDDLDTKTPEEAGQIQERRIYEWVGRVMKELGYTERWVTVFDRVCTFQKVNVFYFAIHLQCIRNITHVGQLAEEDSQLVLDHCEHVRKTVEARGIPNASVFQMMSFWKKKKKNGNFKPLYGSWIHRRCCLSIVQSFPSSDAITAAELRQEKRTDELKHLITSHFK